MAITQRTASKSAVTLRDLLSAVFLVLTLNVICAARVYPVDRSKLVLPDQAQIQSARPAWHSPASRRNILGLERDKITGFGKWAAGTNEKIVKVLGIRVEFQAEDPDDPNTTGIGLFDRRSAEAFHDSSGHDFDATPHGKQYFDAHMRALKQYWQVVSNGMITLDCQILPTGELDAYQLPRQMGYYGEQEPLEGLTEFVADAAAEALAADPSIVFADYDAVFVFHAGADRQSDLGFPETPSDLFTGYIPFTEPIRLNGGTDSLLDAIIIPETTAQDGRINVINSVVVHEFGHTLGLVDLYKTRAPFLTQVGNFALMDNNAADIGIEIAVDGRRRILFGALPVFPCAWSRAYLGFVAIDSATSDGAFEVHAAERDGNNFQPQAVYVPISAEEYYLIESRFFDLDGDAFSGLRADSMTNVILGPADTATSAFNREYDFLLPSSGILIWHVDESVAWQDTLADDIYPNNFIANTLQWNAERRFLTVEEADGIVDLGGYYSVGSGSAADYFRGPSTTRFGPFTNPPTVSRRGAYTGITIDNISRLDHPMSFDVLFDGHMEGFPVWAGGMMPGRSPVVADGDGDQQPELFTVYRNAVCAWNHDGSSMFGAIELDTITNFDRSDVVRSRAVIATVDGTFEYPPVVGVMDGSDFSIDMAAASRDSNVLYFWHLDDRGDGLVDPVIEWELTSVPTTPVIAVGRSVDQPLFRLLLVGTLDGSVILANPATGFADTLLSVAAPILSLAGPDSSAVFVLHDGLDSRWLWKYPDRLQPRAAVPRTTIPQIAVGDLDRDGSYDAVVVSTNGEIHAYNSELTSLEGLPKSTGFEFQSGPTLADLDEDGYLEILVSSDGVIRAFNRFGIPLTDYPLQAGSNSRLPDVIGRPIVNNDSPRGGSAVTVGTDQELLQRFGGDGSWLGDGPRAVSGTVSGAPVSFSFVPPGEAIPEGAIAAIDDDGYLSVFSGFEIDDNTPSWWPQEYHDAFNTATVAIGDLLSIVTSPQFLPEATTYVYPNPAVDAAHVRFWLGENADVEIRIYDLAGNLVEEAQTVGYGQVDNEWTWDCRDYASGVYFCRVEAAGTSGTREHRICRMAIVR